MSKRVAISPEEAADRLAIRELIEKCLDAVPAIFAANAGVFESAPRPYEAGTEHQRHLSKAVGTQKRTGSSSTAPSSACQLERDRGFADSPLERDGFELLVRRHESPRFPKHPG
jgi:hypothetical protein